MVGYFPKIPVVETTNPVQQGAGSGKDLVAVCVGGNYLWELWDLGLSELGLWPADKAKLLFLAAVSGTLYFQFEKHQSLFVLK